MPTLGGHSMHANASFCPPAVNVVDQGGVWETQCINLKASLPVRGCYWSVLNQCSDTAAAAAAAAVACCCCSSGSEAGCMMPLHVHTASQTISTCLHPPACRTLVKPAQLPPLPRPRPPHLPAPPGRAACRRLRWRLPRWRCCCWQPEDAEVILEESDGSNL